MEQKVIRIARVDPASLMAFGFCYSVIVGPILMLLSSIHWISLRTYVGMNRTFGMTVLWYVLFVIGVTFGNLVLGWLLDLALAWCRGVNLEVTDEGTVPK